MPASGIKYAYHTYIRIHDFKIHSHKTMADHTDLEEPWRVEGRLSSTTSD